MRPKGWKDRFKGPPGPDVDKLEAQLTRWAGQIDDLAAMAGKAGAKVKIEFRLSIDDLKLKRVLAQEKVDQFKAAGSGKWEELKAGIELAWCDLETAISDLKL